MKITNQAAPTIKSTTTKRDKVTTSEPSLCPQVDDQMKLLQDSWSEMLILDHMHHRMHNNLPDETQLPNGQKFELLSLALLGVPSMAEKFLEISDNLKQLNFDQADYVCLKFILLLNAGNASECLEDNLTACLPPQAGEVRNLNNRQHVQECSEQVYNSSVLNSTLRS